MLKRKIPEEKSTNSRKKYEPDPKLDPCHPDTELDCELCTVVKSDDTNKKCIGVCVTRSKSQKQVLLCTRPAKYPHDLNNNGENLCCKQHMDQEMVHLPDYTIRISFDNNRVVYTQYIKLAETKLAETKVVEDEGDRCVVPIPPLEKVLPDSISEIVVCFESDFDVCFEDGKEKFVNYEKLSKLLGKNKGRIIKKLIINKPLKINNTNKTTLSEMFRFVETIETKAGVKCDGDMSKLFSGSKLKNFVEKTWDMKNVTSMQKMFYNAHEFNGDISEWKTSQVEDMSQMFEGAEKFNGDVSKWDTSKVKDMSQMFKDAEKFNGNLFKWNTSEVKDMSLMFFNAESFNQNISKWKTGNVEKMAGMFTHAELFDQNISQWDTSKVTDMSGMFWCAVSFNQDISKWKTGKVQYMTHMFRKAKKFNGDISTWNFDSISSEHGITDIFKGSAVPEKILEKILEKIVYRIKRAQRV